MGTNVGSAYVTIMPSMRGFAAELSKSMDASGTSAGESLGKSISTGIDSASGSSTSALSKLGGVAKAAAGAAVAGFTSVAAGVTAIGSQALSAYADYEQLVGGIDTLFGDASATVQQYAAEAYKTSGLSANEYMEQATSFAASLVSSCGGDTAAAAEYANTAMQDMADNANKMGTDMESIQNAYQGFAKQDYTMLDNLKLGYGGTKEEMEQLISDANELRAAQGKNADLTIDSYADVVEAIHTVQENLGITGTTAEEASTTISGSIGMAKASWENFLTGLARDDVDFSQLTEQFLDSIGAVATNVAPRVAQIAKGITEALPTVLAGLSDVLAPVLSEALAAAWNIGVQALAAIGIKLPTVDSSQVLSALQGVLDFASQVVSRIGAVLGTLGEALAPALEALSGVLSPLFETVTNTLLPALDTIGQAIGELVTAWMPLVTTAVETVAPIIGQVIEVVGQLVAQIAEGLSPIIQDIAAIVEEVLPIVQERFQAFGEFVQGVIDAVFPFIQTVVETVMDVVGAVIETVLAFIQGDWEGVWNGIQNIASSVWEGIQNLIDSAIDAVWGVIESALDLITGTWENVWNGIKDFFGNIWEGIQEGASNGITAVFDTVTGIKDTITNFFSNAGEWLIESGKAILEGLKNGILGAVDSVKNGISGAIEGIRNLFPFSPAKEGPFSGHGYTTWSGRALMGDFADSIESQAGKVASATSTVLDVAQRGLDAELTAPGASLSLSGSSYKGGATALEVYDAVRAAIGSALESGLGVYVDGKRLVAATAGEMNTRLGALQVRGAR